MLRSGWLTTGPRVKRFEESFAAAVSASHAVGMNSCTAALHLALEHPERFRAIIGLQAGAHVDPYYDLNFLHRSDVHGGEVCAALISGLIAPQSPPVNRHETLWMYMQGGPGVFKGDLYFYKLDGDTWTICLATRGTKRPSKFGTTTGAEIKARVASFRAHQERFNREREAYCTATMAKVHASLKEGELSPPRLDK